MSTIAKLIALVSWIQANKETAIKVARAALHAGELVAQLTASTTDDEVLANISAWLDKVFPATPAPPQ